MNNSAPPPPPPPPPHGSNPRSTNSSSSSGLPPGNYDIFIIPPHSSGGGFLYLPSLQPHRNSFLAGVACALLAVGVWQAVSPMLKQWTSHLVASGGQGVVLLIVAIGVAGWALGRTQIEGVGTGGGASTAGGRGGGGQQGAGTANAAPPPPPNAGGPDPGAYQQQQQHQQQQQQQQQQHQQHYQNHQQEYQQREQQQQQWQRAPPKPSWSSTNAGTGAQSAWEKAREETRRREEDRKRAEELKKKQEEAAKKKEEADKAAKAAAEKEKWEQMRAREKEAREREARERLAKERLEKARKEAEAKQAAATPAPPPPPPQQPAAPPVTPKFGVGEKTDPYAGSNVSPSRQYQKPSARSFLGTDIDGGGSGARGGGSGGDEHSYRPYDARRAHKATSASSFVSESPSFYSSAPSHSTARTSPPPSRRGPYSTKDPDKIVIKAVYLFNNMFAKPVAQLVSGTGSVTDGLILRITTEGCFVDDDVRGVGQREWDVKAWGMKLVETGSSGQTHVLRASVRDTEGKKYVFILPEAESWKVNVGLQRLRRGTQVRSLGVNGMQAPELKRMLDLLGW